MALIEENAWVWSKKRNARAKVIEVTELWGQMESRPCFPGDDGGGKGAWVIGRTYGDARGFGRPNDSN